MKNYQVFTSAKQLVEDYDKQNLVNDATIKIDLENDLISSPKLFIDFDTLVLGKKTVLETDAVNLRSSIVKDMKEVRSTIMKATDLPEKSKFLEAFDADDLSGVGTDIMNRKDINYIKTLFFTEDGRAKTLKGKAVDIIGRDMVINLRDKLKQLIFLEEQVKVAKDRETEKKLNC